MRFFLACTGMGVLVALAPALAGAQTGEAVAAVWKEQHVDFVYQGRTSRYSCEGLHDKVRAMLLDLGARRDLKITALGCDVGDTLANRLGSPRLYIVFFAPALPDRAGEAVRVGGLTTAAARFETFTISNDAFRNMGMGDCELVEEFARQILPKLTTRALQQDITCVPGQGAGRFLVRGEILKTVAP